MKLTVREVNGWFRVYEEDGQIARRAGLPVDGGGVRTSEEARRLAAREMDARSRKAAGGRVPDAVRRAMDSAAANLGKPCC